MRLIACMWHRMFRYLSTSVNLGFRFYQLHSMDEDLACGEFTIDSSYNAILPASVLALLLKYYLRVIQRFTF